MTFHHYAENEYYVFLQKTEIYYDCLKTKLILLPFLFSLNLNSNSSDLFFVYLEDNIHIFIPEIDKCSGSI